MKFSTLKEISSNFRIYLRAKSYMLSSLFAIFVMCLSTPAEGQITQIGGDITKNRGDYFTGFDLVSSDDGSVVGLSSLRADTENEEGYALIEVFKNISGEWTRQGDSLVSDDGVAPINGEIQMSGDGNLIVFSQAVETDSNSIIRVKTFQYSEGNWRDIGMNIDPQANTRHLLNGYSLSEDGQTLAVIGYSFEPGLATVAFFIETFRFSSDGWLRFGEPIENENPSEVELLGSSIDISRSGNILAVLNHSQHSVQVYELDINRWVRRGEEINIMRNSPIFSKINLSDDGNNLAFIDRRENEVLSFQYISGNYQQLGDPMSTLDNPGSAVRIAMSGDGQTIVVLLQDPSASSLEQLLIFNFSEGTWENVGKVYTGTLFSTEFFYNLDLSSDGKSLFHNGIALLREESFVRALDISALLTSAEFAVPNNPINVFPNPSTNSIQVRGDFQVQSLRLYSMTGGLLANDASGSTTLRHDLPSGTYLLIAETNRGIHRQQVVVTR